MIDVPSFGSCEEEESALLHDEITDEGTEPESNEEDEELTEEEMEEERALLKSAFQALGTDLPILIRGIKPHVLIRDMKMVEPGIYNRFFRGFRPDKIGRGRMVRILSPEVLDRQNIRIMQLLTLHWNHANDPIYKAMRDLVATINPEVEEVEKIEDEQAADFVSQLKETGFKREAIHICVQLNGVRFSKEFVEKNLSPTAAPSA